MTAADGCGSHAGIGDDLRELVRVALDRIDPVLDRLRSEPDGSEPDGSEQDGSGGGPAACASCPICAVIAALRGERPELAVRLAEHAAGLVAVLRTALEDSGPATAAPADEADAPPVRHVQRITVHRRTP
ncbi:hypothetical protein BJF90_37215 [Pseudonocardia sp. CNS-004]|nr:hypothetical protein BJF90_37215 [Pseudonocardia sp. CNS-004]